MRLIYLDCKLLEVGTFYFHASHNAVAVLARSSSDKPHSKMLKQEVVKCKGLLSHAPVAICFLYCTTPFYPSICWLHPHADAWPKPSFASPLNWALLSYEINMQFGRCSGGGHRELYHPERV